MTAMSKANYDLNSMGTSTCSSTMASVSVKSEPAESTEVDTTFDPSWDPSIDEGDSEDERGEGPASLKQNGYATLNTDRYGFTGGAQYTEPGREEEVPLEVLRKRELKWLDMLENWEKWMSKRFKKVKERCRKGIPPSLRARAWQYLCGSKFLMDHNKGKYEQYLMQPAHPRWRDDIEKDLDRQFPFHEIFATRGGHGQEDLADVLKAYTIHNPQDGYCQAQGPIAAVLLMHMPAEQAFWCLVSICEKYLPGYYSPGLEAVQIDGDVLFGLLKKASPPTYKHLKKQKVDPVLYMTEWFMCVFARTLPWSTVLRVWDMFFCEGVKVMFRVSLVFFKHILSQPSQLAECPTMFETIELLRHLPADVMEAEFLTRECGRLTVTERDMEKEHQHQLSKRRALKEKANRPDSGSKKKGKSKKKKVPTATLR